MGSLDAEVFIVVGEDGNGLKGFSKSHLSGCGHFLLLIKEMFCRREQKKKCTKVVLEKLQSSFILSAPRTFALQPDELNVPRRPISRSIPFPPDESSS